MDRYEGPKLTKCPKRGIPAQESITDLETLTNLIFYKEVVETKAMTEALKKKVMEEGKKFYDVWMYEVSDNIQAMALAFGERYSLEAAMAALSKVTCPKVREALTKIVRLHCLLYVKENLGFYLTQGIISHKAALSFDADYQ